VSTIVNGAYFEAWREGKGKPGKSTSKPYPIDDLSDILNDTVPPRPVDLIADIVPADARHIEIVGFEGHGKTMVVQILALQAAIGRAVFGTYATARPLRIVFLEDDSPSGVMKRREAAIVKYMRPNDAERRWLRSNFLPIREAGFMFNDPGPLRLTLAEQVRKGEPVDMVIVDSRTTAWPSYGQSAKSLASWLCLSDTRPKRKSMPTGDLSP
jgi:hypothetical protein